MKKSISLLLICCLVLLSFLTIDSKNVYANKDVEEFSTQNTEGVEESHIIGDGTVDNPYQISTVDDLLWFAEMVNSDKTHLEYGSKNYVLMNDIDLSNINNWNPIGISGKGFSGTFDGNNKTLMNLKIIKSFVSADLDYFNNQVGFFGYSTGTVRDFVLENATIIIDLNTTESNIANIIGGIIGTNNGAVSNLHFNGEIKITSKDNSRLKVGGVSGENMNMIDISSSSGNIKVINDYVENNENFIGGITGENTGIINNCVNDASIYTEGYSFIVGGISGSSYNKISDVINKGSIIGQNKGHYVTYFGGILGVQFSGDKIGTIENAINTGNINSNVYSGGIVGAAFPSYYKGTILLQRLSNFGNVKGDYAAGGIVGWMSERVTLQEAYNRGEVLANTFSGGIAGITYSETVKDVYNTGYVESYFAAGGIIGGLEYLRKGLFNAYNVGIVQKNPNSLHGGSFGGIAGTLQTLYNYDNTIYYLDNIDKAVGDKNNYYLTQKKTKEQMVQQETFEGFDFDSVWVMSNPSYPPVLRSLYVPLESLDIRQEPLVTGQKINILNPEPVNATIINGNYASTNESVLKVETSGYVTALDVGFAYIVGSPYDLDANIFRKIEVKQGVTSILVPEFLTIYIGEEVKIPIEVLPDTSYNREVSWTSENDFIATVDQSGVVKGIEPGETIIHLKALDGSGTESIIRVNVMTRVEEVRFEYEYLDIYVGEETPIKYTIFPDSASNKNVFFTSSDESVAYVNESHKLIAESVGDAVITILTEDGSYEDQLTVHVYNKIEGVRILNRLSKVVIGSTYQIDAEIYPTDTKETQLTWMSSDPSVVIIDSEGVLTAVGQGEALITVSTPQMEHIDYIELTVGSRVESIEINGPDDTSAGVETKYIAQLHPADAIIQELSWSVIPFTGAGTIDQDGIFKGTKAGTIYIRAEATDGSGVQSEKEVIVLPVDPLMDKISASRIAYGSPLSESKLVGNFLDPNTLVKISGKLDWVDETEITKESSVSYEWEFIPDSTNYTTIRGVIDASEMTGYSVNLEVHIEGRGNVLGEGIYKSGEAVTIEAKPAIGYKFIHWTEGDEILSTDEKYIFPSTKHRTITAHFELIKLNPSIEKISASRIAYGSPLLESRLVGDFLDPNTLVKISGKLNWVDETEITKESSVSYEWEFIPDSTNYTTIRGVINASEMTGYSVNLEVQVEGQGSVLGEGIYKSGEAVTIEAKPAIGYKFIHWTEGDEILSTDEKYIFPSTKHRTITAYFEIVKSENLQIMYRTHVQSYGWQQFVSDGTLSGTIGLAKRLEAIEIKIEGKDNLSVKYSTHVEKIGWQNYVSDGQLSGTEGRALRLEAIKIELTGLEADQYDIYYRAHAEKFGWLGWAKNGHAAGTAGYGYRLEAIEIKIVKKGDNPYPMNLSAYRDRNIVKNITYRTHVQSVGWQDFVSDGKMSGTEGRRLRLEGIEINLGKHLPSGSVEYSTHVQRIGWTDDVRDGMMSGTEGRALRLEAIRIHLKGEISKQYDIYYRVHSEKIGWMGWAKNGEEAGTSGYAYRLEGIEIMLIDKGGDAPGIRTDHYRVK